MSTVCLTIQHRMFHKKTMKMSPRCYYSRMTVVQLKRILKERKLTTGGRKADLVERIVEAERANMECTRTHTGHCTSVSDTFIETTAAFLFTPAEC